ncbi:MAG: hypothetical protein R2748_01575 [Bryobacterales bacterium]
MAFGPLSRRAFLATTAGALAAATAPAQRSASTYRTYFGDLHNHNAIGYAQGSLRRTFEIARNHLDFFAFTPHGYWPDIGHYQDTIEDRWINGFAVVKERWPEVLSMAQEFDDPGKFSCIVGYERHSTEVGDYHILFPELEAPYERHTELADFQKFAKKHGALLIPHHPANRRGERGADPTFGTRKSARCSRSTPNGAPRSMIAHRIPTSATPTADAGPRTPCNGSSPRAAVSACSPAPTITSATRVATARAWPPSRRPT